MIKNVFVVDDDEMFSSLLVDHLSKNKMIKVHHFLTGEEALNAIDKNPLVVVLDYNLSTVDKQAANGLTILKEMKKTQPNVHAIMLSSQTNYGVAAFSISEGAEQYVMKDETSFEKIQDIINEIIKEQRLV